MLKNTEDTNLKMLYSRMGVGKRIISGTGRWGCKEMGPGYFASLLFAKFGERKFYFPPIISVLMYGKINGYTKNLPVEF